MHHIALLHKELFGLCAYRLDNGVREELFFIQALYTFVQVDASCVGTESVWPIRLAEWSAVRDSHGRPGMVIRRQQIYYCMSIDRLRVS